MSRPLRAGRTAQGTPSSARLFSYLHQVQAGAAAEQSPELQQQRYQA